MRGTPWTSNDGFLSLTFFVFSLILSLPLFLSLFLSPFDFTLFLSFPLSFLTTPSFPVSLSLSLSHCLTIPPTFLSRLALSLPYTLLSAFPNHSHYRTISSILFTYAPFRLLSAFFLLSSLTFCPSLEEHRERNGEQQRKRGKRGRGWDGNKKRCTSPLFISPLSSSFPLPLSFPLFPFLSLAVEAMNVLACG